jgi:hypothetical protein
VQRRTPVFQEIPCRCLSTSSAAEETRTKPICYLITSYIGDHHPPLLLSEEDIVCSCYSPALDIRQSSILEHTAESISTMGDCGCRMEIIKWLCGCWNEDSVLTVKCGRRLSKTNRKLFCKGVEAHTTYMTECCSAPMCQVKRFTDQRWRCCKCANENQRHYNCSGRPHCAHRCCHECTQDTLHDVAPGAAPDNLLGLSPASGAAAVDFTSVNWMVPASNARATPLHSSQQKRSPPGAGTAASGSPLPIRPTSRRATAHNHVESILTRTSNQDAASCGYQGMAAPNPGVAPGRSRGRKSQLLEATTTPSPSTGFGWAAGAALNDLHDDLGQRPISGPAPSSLHRKIPRASTDAVTNSRSYQQLPG